MKTMFKPFATLAVVAAAAFGAFAFKPVAKEEAFMPFGLIPGTCAQSEVECSQDSSQPFCTDGAVDLYDWNKAHTDCSVRLYQKIQD